MCGYCQRGMEHINLECFNWLMSNAANRPPINIEIEAVMPAGFSLRNGINRGA